MEKLTKIILDKKKVEIVAGLKKEHENPICTLAFVVRFVSMFFPMVSLVITTLLTEDSFNL